MAQSNYKFIQKNESFYLGCKGKCPKVKKPVCSVDGKQYNNLCLAKCDGAEVGCKHQCPCPEPIGNFWSRFK